MALLIGMCYSGVEINQRGIQDIEGVLFIYITENTFPSVYAVLNVFPLELPLFLREYKNGIYRCDTYYIAKMAALVSVCVCLFTGYLILVLCSTIFIHCFLYYTFRKLMCVYLYCVLLCMHVSASQSCLAMIPACVCERELVN